MASRVLLPEALAGLSGRAGGTRQGRPGREHHRDYVLAIQDAFNDIGDPVVTAGSFFGLRGGAAGVP